MPLRSLVRGLPTPHFQACPTEFTITADLCAKRDELSPQAGVILLAKERDEDTGQHKGKFLLAFRLTALEARPLSILPDCGYRQRPWWLDTNAGSSAAARLWCAFTTESMAVAFASSLSPKPNVRLVSPKAPPMGLNLIR